MRSLDSVFKNRTSFSQELWGESNKIIKSQKIYWPWGLKTTWATWTQKTYLFIRKSKTLTPIFTNKTSFSLELWVKSSKIMKPQKMYWPWGLGPRNYIWATWAQKTYPTISPEPWLQYSQTAPHFFKNHKMNPIKFWHVKNLNDLGA